MKPERQEIQRYIEELLRGLARDWDYDGEIGADTRLFADLGSESLDVVIMGTAIQEHYQQALPFAELLAEVGQREVRDLTVGEVVEFVERHLTAKVGEGAA